MNDHDQALAADLSVWSCHWPAQMPTARLRMDPERRHDAKSRATAPSHDAAPPPTLCLPSLTMMAPNSRKKTYELPPALQTRPRNKEWVVGAPDMPNPHRTHEEVVQEQTQKAAEKARADAQRDAAKKRALDIEVLSAENTPTIGQATANMSSSSDLV